jgi:MFS family permease
LELIASEPYQEKSQAIDAAVLRRIILASSLGTMFEWYDFYLYGSLAGFFGGLFFPKGSEVAQLLASLATFGSGFGVRPLGAIVFGHIGDRVGRKYTFLVTLTTMGVSTAVIGLLPTYATLGLGATALLVFARLAQGLAIGGEYGGAATYVAEHVPDGQRGYYTSFIQTTATVGFFVSLAVIGATRSAFGEDAFKSYGWRIPFLLSFVLLGVSLYVRLRMAESPLFSRLKSSGQTSKNPLKESFTNPLNLKYVLIALFGVTAGQGVVWYTGQFYALTFLQSVLKLSWQTAYTSIAMALVLATPLYVFFGWLSDRVGRKRIMLLGMALGALTFVPIFMALQHAANPAGLPIPDPARVNQPMLVLFLFLQMVYGCMTYGPIAAFLVELFPTQIRYTSMSLPYHLGNGWFGGFLPLIATALTTSNVARSALGPYAIYAGLAYPIAVCLVSLCVGGLLLKETRGHKIDARAHDSSAQ